MTTTQTFPTRSNDLAQFLAYALPEHSLSRIVKGTSGPGSHRFFFEDAPVCKKLADEFYSEGPVAIGDLWRYNFAVRELKRSIRHADQYGEWQRGDSH